MDCWEVCGKAGDSRQMETKRVAGVVQERLKQDFTKEQHRQVADFYFNHYRTHFMSKPSLADALASIPQVQQVRKCLPA